MGKDTTAFKLRFELWKNGGKPYENGRVNWPRWDDALITSYTIPFIDDKAVKLTNAGRATGAVLSTNLLDSLADNAMRAGIPVRTAIGLATKESTLGNPTDDKTAWNLSSGIRKLFNGVYPGTAQHINDGTNLVNGVRLINYHKGDINHEMFNGAQGKSIIQEGFEFYKTHPDKYNPGLKGYQKAVNARGDEVMNSPEVKKWYKEWEDKLIQVKRPEPYKITTNILNTASPKFGSYKNGKLPGFGDGRFGDDVYKRLYREGWSETKPEYEGYIKKGVPSNVALLWVKNSYNKSDGNDYYFDGGQLPEVVVKPNPDSKSTVTLRTYYPLSRRYPLTGHSELETEGGNWINVNGNYPQYNLLTNNCADATKKGLELASGKKLNTWVFTTPGDVLDFALSLGGKYVDPIYRGPNKMYYSGANRGYSEVKLLLPTKSVRKLADYSKLLRLGLHHL